MTATPAFSVLLPVYAGDTPAFFSRAFRSATDQQTLPPDQVVLVQDGPVSDQLARTLELLIAETAVPVALVVLGRNSGLAQALEAGLDATAHDIVARMDADDIAEPNRFAAQIPKIAEGYDMVGSAIREFVEDAEGEHPGIVRVPPLEEERIRSYARFHSPFNHPTVVFRTSAVRSAGGYRHLDLLEDYWLFGRMIRDGARVVNLPEPLVRYRVSSGAYARRGGWRILRSELLLQGRFLREGFTTPPQFARNVLLRGGYRLVPQAFRRLAYRRMIARGFTGDSA